jgi:thiol-disulfide isomerase/thioredoxin
MNRIHVLVAILVVVLVAVAASANEKPHNVPDTAVCQTCAARGSEHCEEKVVAWREYKGAHYYFCSQKCGETFDGFPEAYVPRSVPRPAPQMVLSTLNDEQIVLGKVDGDVILLDFWATWCAPCLKAMPKLEELQEEFAPSGFSIVGISIDEDAKKLEDFLGEKQLSYPIVHDTGSEPAWQSFFVVGIPAMVLLDAQGRVVGEWRGEVNLNAVRQAIEAQVTVEADYDESD